jgi:hypothetical protein
MNRWEITPALSRALLVSGLLVGGAVLLGQPALVVLAAPFVVLAAFALIACGSAVLRVLPRMVVEGQDWPGSRSAEAARQAPDHR